MSLREDQCNKVCRILDDVLANRPTERDSLIVAVRKEFAEPKIIRCKNCKHWIPYEWMFSEVWQSKNIADYPEEDIGCDCSDMAMKANDFCSRGEKREVTT